MAPLPDEDVGEGLQIESLSRRLRAAGPPLRVVRASALTGEGLDAVMDWVRGADPDAADDAL